jgi:hypothetical protein
MALAMEMADRDAQHLQAGQGDKAVPVVEAAVHNTGGSNFSQSGGAKTVTGVVVDIGLLCNSCGKKGHLARTI